MRLWIRGFTCFSFYTLISCTVSLPQQSQIKNIKTVPRMEHSIKKSLQKKEIFLKANGQANNGGYLITAQNSTL